MHKRHFLVLTASLVFGSLISGSVTMAADTKAFPLRLIYPKVKVIEIDELTTKLKLFTVIDVRSPLEYSVMHIKDAINIPTSDTKFVDTVKQAVANNGNKTAVFYCNGHRCHHSYEAGKRMNQDSFTFDGGINDWAEKNPQLTILFDKPFDPKFLITQAQFDAKSLPPIDFMKKATADSSAIILDVRENFQLDGITIFPGREIRVGMDKEKLTKIINTAKAENKALFIFDDSGARVWLLQYFLEDRGVKNYYFLQRGTDGYLQMIQGK